MPLPFSGAARPLSPSDLVDAAARLGCRVEAVRAVRTVETGDLSGFLSDGSGRPRILFESATFGRLTGNRFTVSHPLISTRGPNWKLYRGGAAEYDRLAEAFSLDRTAALEATSWGSFQVMGENFPTLGFATVEAMVEAFAASEAAQLAGFVSFVTAAGLRIALQNADWERFARVYNGPANVPAYSRKLAVAFAAAMGHPPVDGMLRIGCSGADVAVLQRALSGLGYVLVSDGTFGRVTELAVQRFQSSRGLAVDGVVGPATRRALGLSG